MIPGALNLRPDGPRIEEPLPRTRSRYPPPGMIPEDATARCATRATEVDRVTNDATWVVPRPTCTGKPLPRRYDALLFLDETRALRPLKVAAHEEADLPETFPSGV